MHSCCFERIKGPQGDHQGLNMILTNMQAPSFKLEQVGESLHGPPQRILEGRG